ncbi:MAG: PIN domain-containing protein [Synechococcales bacterium]|nr:PIN domain-containing protein [Synechococcales bacterium]
MDSIILDTGPLIAYLNPHDRHHQWAIKILSSVNLPLRSCEAVIAEAYFLLRRDHIAADALMRLLEAGIIQIPFSLTHEIFALRELMRRYQSVPMSLADACLVRMSELDSKSKVLTLDSDFLIYRRDRNAIIPIIMP